MSRKITKPADLPLVQSDYIDEKMDSLISSLPLSHHEHPINTQLRWLLSDKISDKNMYKYLQYFALSNFRGPEYTIGRYNHAQELIDTFSWEEKFDKIMSNAWMAFEFFLVDHLYRYPFEHNKLSFSHIKASPYLDHTWKIDFVSNLSPKKETPISIGIQLTTQHSNLHPFHRNHEKSSKKKKTIVMDNSSLITLWDDVLQAYPSVLQPNMTAYMVVNGSINELINTHKNNVFQTAFHERVAHGLRKWWPSPYLPKEVRQDLGKLWYAYYQSLVEFYNFLDAEKKKWSSAFTDEMEDLFVQKDQRYAVMRKFIPKYKELNHTIFTDFYSKKAKSKDGNLLCNISYFLHDGLLEK